MASTGKQIFVAITTVSRDKGTPKTERWLTREGELRMALTKSCGTVAELRRQLAPALSL